MSQPTLDWGGGGRSSQQWPAASLSARKLVTVVEVCDWKYGLWVGFWLLACLCLYSFMYVFFMYFLMYLCILFGGVSTTLIMDQGPMMASARKVGRFRRAETTVQIVGHLPFESFSARKKGTGS